MYIIDINVCVSVYVRARARVRVRACMHACVRVQYMMYGLETESFCMAFLCAFLGGFCSALNESFLTKMV